jgi:hypothetical protein
VNEALDAGYAGLFTLASPRRCVPRTALPWPILLRLPEKRERTKTLGAAFVEYSKRSSTYSLSLLAWKSATRAWAALRIHQRRRRSSRLCLRRVSPTSAAFDSNIVD